MDDSVELFREPPAALKKVSVEEAMEGLAPIEPPDQVH